MQVPHRGVVSLLSSVAETFGVTQDDVLLSVTSLSFDIAGLELFMPLLRGARVVVAARDEAADSARLAEMISGSGATVMQATPTTWRLLLEGGWEPVPPRLKVICGGEALDAKLAARLRGRCAELWNYYGPTETTIWSTAYRVEGDEETIPIGRPLANTQVYVLDEGMGAAPLGVAGELYIGGVGLARGYANRPALTAEKFVPNPFAESGGERLYRTGDLVRYRPDGEIEYLGRLDHQVKMRGFRIELGEIEAVLAKHEAVEQAVVVVQGRETGAGPRLAAYYVGGAGAEELRQWAKAKLPEYMVPWALVRLEQMPVTPNGKVDRRALPEATAEDAATHAAPAAPRTLVEEMVAGVWREVLGLEGVGVNDDFFELGGHSLLAVRVITRLRESFQLEMPLRIIFENRTVASLAGVIEERKRVANNVQSPHIPRAPKGKEPTLSITQESWLLREWAEGLYSVKSRVMNTQMAYRLRGPLDVKALERTLNEIVRRHDSLRSTFPKPKGVLSFKFLRPLFRLMMESRKARKALSRKPHTPMPRVKALGEPYLRILPKLTLRLPVIDLRGREEGEREAECQRAVYEAARTPFDHERGPLVRAVLLRTRDDEHVLTVVISHYACDGWSMKVLLDEIEKLYGAFAAGKESPLPELPIQYPDYALWQRKWLSGEVLKSMTSYWKQKLDKIGLYPVVELPFARAGATST
ncbi:MAG TPA: AMP-binding protein, partial [Pyrinomonadaceae bacterium]